jgi:predicted enzyme related to lactoylglutathione lyase
VNFNGVLIGSEDPKRLAEYYTRLFGKPMFDDSGYTGWQIGSAGMTVGPHSEIHGRNGEPGRIIWNIETPDVRGDFDRMKAAGAVIVREPYTMDGAPPDSFIATLEDPDGNYFQLMSPMDPTAM